MIHINPKKLLNSKWTRVSPSYKEKHFIIVDVEFDEEERVETCIIEAVINSKEYSINWKDLKDQKKWLQGWK